MSNPIRVTVWHEYRHEKTHKEVSDLYPKGMHEAIADGLRPYADLKIHTATLDEPEHGLKCNACYGEPPAASTKVGVFTSLFQRLNRPKRHTHFVVCAPRS